MISLRFVQLLAQYLHCELSAFGLLLSWAVRAAAGLTRSRIGRRLNLSGFLNVRSLLMRQAPFGPAYW